MKKLRKFYLSSLAAFILLVLTTVTVSAAKVGDPYTYLGVQIGWWIFFGVIGLSLVLALVFKIKVLEAAWRVFAVLAVIAVIGLVIANFDMAVTPEPADITPDVTWDVTATSSSSDTTIDNDARTITKLIGTFAAGSVINSTVDQAWVDAEDDLWVNFSISPSMAIGVSLTTNQATTNCIVYNPDQKFTEDSTSYFLFELVSSGGDRNLAWTTDGTTDYESKLCTVTIGGAETAGLRVNLLDDGLCLREAGDTNVFTISVGGITYTVYVIVTILHVG
jgi:hypothetical protein